VTFETDRCAVKLSFITQDSVLLLIWGLFIGEKIRDVYERLLRIITSRSTIDEGMKRSIQM